MLLEQSKAKHAVKPSGHPPNTHHEVTDLRKRKQKSSRPANFLPYRRLEVYCSRRPQLSPSHPRPPKRQNAPPQTAEPAPELPPTEGPAEHRPPGAQQQNELLSPGGGSRTPGPAHRPSHNPLGKGQGRPPGDAKAAAGAAAAFPLP